MRLRISIASWLLPINRSDTTRAPINPKPCMKILSSLCRNSGTAPAPNSNSHKGLWISAKIQSPVAPESSGHTDSRAYNTHTHRYIYIERERERDIKGHHFRTLEDVEGPSYEELIANPTKKHYEFLTRSPLETLHTWRPF